MKAANVIKACHYFSSHLIRIYVKTTKCQFSAFHERKAHERPSYGKSSQCFLFRQEWLIACTIRDAGTCTCYSEAPDQFSLLFSPTQSLLRMHVSLAFTHSPSNDDASLQSCCSRVTPSFFSSTESQCLALKLGTAPRLINSQRHRHCWALVNQCNTMSAPANNSPPLATPTVGL